MSEHETLAKNIKPLNYALQLEPDMQTFKTRGKETVDIFVREPTDSITLNSSELTINGASVEIDRDNVKANEIKFDEENGRVTFGFLRKFQGKVKLHVDFTAENNEKMHGFYRSKYTLDGKAQDLLTTQFEPIDARTAFPCIDEPESKATVDVKLIVDKNLDAISNMPKKSTRSLDGILAGKKEITFRRTPKMSTYLLYVGVGKFERNTERSGKTEISITATPGKQDQTDLPRGYAKKILKYYEGYFGIKFPLPKIDFIAIPDFPAGAMENWGAITFREKTLMCSDKSSEVERSSSAEVIAHELAHQWFGNLVTMKWWDDLWLNESFATLMADKATGALFPKWKTNLLSVPQMFQAAFYIDALKSTHPINVEIKRASEANGIFDAISYKKGGSILHMAEDYIGPGNFRRGLKRYLKAHKYRNATKSDLWDALSGSSARGKDIKTTMRAWVEKPGYPIIYVEKGDDGRFILRQKRFLLSGDVDDKWPVPIHYKTNKGEGFIFMDREEAVIDEEADWIKLNYGQHGFYRAGYTPTLLDKLGHAIVTNELSPIDAWGVTNDLFTVVRAGRAPADSYLDFVSKFARSLDYPLVSSTIENLDWICMHSRDTDLEKKAQSLILESSAQLLEKLTWSRARDDSAIEIKLRSDAIAKLGLNGDKEVISRSRELFEASMSGKEIDPDLQGTIYDIAANAGNRDTYNQLVSTYKNTKSLSEKQYALCSIGRFNDPVLLREALDFAHSAEVRPQDSFRVASIAGANKNGTDVLWNWMKENWSSLKERYSPGAGLLGRYITSLSLIHDQKHKEDIVSFFADKSNMREEDLRRPLDNALERIDINIAYRRMNGLQ